MEQPEGSVHGIQETLEVVDAVEHLTEALVEAIQDGVDVSDAFALLGNAEVKAALIEAARNIDRVPDEVTDLQPEEVFDLAERSVQFTESLYNTLKTMKQR